MYVKRLQEFSQRNQSQQTDIAAVSKSIEALNLEVKEVAAKVKNAENSVEETIRAIFGKETECSTLYNQFYQLKRVGVDVWTQSSSSTHSLLSCII